VSVLPTLEEEFVTSGRLQLRVQPIAILGGESELAAQAAECAGEQGGFWQYSDALFASQAAGEIAISEDSLKDLAEGRVDDAAAFASCLDSGRYEAAVTAATAEAQGQGINSVPATFVNGRKVPATLDLLRSAILEELAGGP
jgi:protein-disulfide isomerase